MSDLTSLVTYIAHNLIQDDKELAVTEVAGDNETVIELKVAENDIGRVIGRNGSIAQSIRQLLSIKTAVDSDNEDERRNYYLEILD